MDFLTIIKAFIIGFRFDISISTIVLIPFIPILFLPIISNYKNLIRGVLYSIFFWFSILLIYNFTDIQYYGFVQRHITFELQNAFGDIGAILKTGVTDYLPEIIGLILFLIIVNFLFIKSTKTFYIKKYYSDKTHILRKIVFDLIVVIIVISLTILFVRGGFQRKSISVSTAFFNDNVNLGSLGLNGIYTTFRTSYKLNTLSLDASSIDLKNLIEDEKKNIIKFITSSNEKIDNLQYPFFRHYTYQPQNRLNFNIVIFVMESWSGKYIGALGRNPSATPFFDELSKDGLLLTNCFANGQRSIEGLSALIASSPSIYHGYISPQGESLFVQTKFEPIGKILNTYGYETIFIQGGYSQSLRIVPLMNILGFNKIIALEDYPTDNKEIFDNLWGVYDEFIFAKALDEFNKTKKPFISAIFSMSTHNPYMIPSKKFEYLNPSSALNRYLNALRYSDYSLKLFFDNVKKTSYFDNTIFIIVADHTVWAEEDIYKSYRIPCLFYAPKIIKKGKYEHIASQFDIVPTIIDILRIRDPFTAWGKSIFDTSNRKTFLANGGYTFIWVDDNFMLLTNGLKPLELYNYKKWPNKNLLENSNTNFKNIADKMFKESIQYYRLSYNVILSNKVSP